METIQTVIAAQRAFFQTGATRALAFRQAQLKTLQTAIRNREDELMQALQDDLGKSEFEAYATEIGMVLSELDHALRNLPRWVKPRRVKNTVVNFPSASRIYAEPYGVALIIAPWNYPVQLALSPLIGAITAGNCGVLKPSEYASHTSAVLTRLIHDHFPTEFLAVIEGPQTTGEAILREKFDIIFFTGSEKTGKAVLAAAAPHLTPVLLELGGKSPCIVTKDARIKTAARRIVWGKLLNAGQTCVAPDYLYVHQSVKDQLIEAMVEQIRRFYGAEPLENPAYPRIVNAHHFQRLTALMKNGTIITGGVFDPERLTIAPTLIEGLTWDAPVMQEEIFGPLLPVLPFEDLSQVIAEVNRHPKPLALYVFSSDGVNQQRLIGEISFGGGCVNDTITHLTSPYLPFGGVGNSGNGSYHGQASFDAFTHYKSVLHKGTGLDIPLRYPPYRNKLRWLKMILK